MPTSTRVLATFSDGGTIGIDADSVNASAIKIQKKTISQAIRSLGHASPVANPRQEIVTVYAVGVTTIPESWQLLIRNNAEVDRVTIEANGEEHLLHSHVSLLYDANTQELTLQGSRYQ